MTSNFFQFRQGELFCEELQIDQLFNSLPNQRHTLTVGEQIISTEVPTTPAYVYSASALQKNVQTYKDAIRECDLKAILGYAVKANGNLNILKSLKSFGVEMLITVSGNEILAGLKAGFDPNKILLNGNGKQRWEIKLAIEQGILLNVDSVFDADRIANIVTSEYPDKLAKVFLRLRPSPDECEVGVHQFVNTSDKSKFGFDINELDEVLECLNKVKTISIIGIHCHLGSCISNPDVYAYLGTFVSGVATILKKRGISSVEFLDVGGGVGINYHKVPKGFEPFESKGQINEGGSKGYNIKDFMKALSHVVSKDFKILVEPGRSLVADTGILVTKVLGSKKVQGKNYMVVDAAMSELIRPCLYGSHHQIYPTKFDQKLKWLNYDVVGPICESADYLGKDIPLQIQQDYIAIMDCGAYAASMSSTYNMRPRPTEILVTGNDVKCIRGRDMFDDLVLKYL